MAFARVNVELNNDTLLPVDKAVNTFHFVTPGTVAAATADITTLLDAFYTAVQSFMSASLTGSGTVKAYDLEDAEPRAPVATGLISFTPGTDKLPNECALCMSFQGATVSGQNQARRRGRIFVGPLTASSVTSGTGDARPAAGLRTALAAAGDALMSQTLLPGLIWAVFSQATAGPPPWTSGQLTNSFVTITNGWVDDSFDTQRSRGVIPTTRTVWS